MITYNGEIIGKVNDSRSITLLKAINKNKDIVTIRRNRLKIYTFRDISKNNEKLKITIFEDDKKRFNRIALQIKDGCRFEKNEIWLFLSEDLSDMTENSMILVLPNNKWCKCLLDGNELKIKQVIHKPRNIRGKNFLVIKNIKDIEFERKSSIKQIDNDGFNDIIARKSENSGFLKMINDYENIEVEILEETKRLCKDLKYKAFEKDIFIISDDHIQNLEKWQNKEGTNVCFKGQGKINTLGSIKEIGEDYIKIEFTDDMIKNSIPRNSGKIGISLYGDEVIHKRRKHAIDILENNSAAISNLAKILGESDNLEGFFYEIMLEKYEIGNLSDMQVDAIEGALNTPEIFLIQGPPGAGKTTVIRNIVKKILDKNQEVLITSFQNLAVDNVLDGFLKSNVVPYRFGDEDNPVMQKICGEIAEEINSALKNNISKEKEEVILNFKENITQLRGRILDSEDEKILSKEIENALLEISKYEGKSTNYLKLKNILDEIKEQYSKSNIEFNIDYVKETMPKEFGYELEILEKIAKTQEYLEQVNNNLKSKTLDRVIEKIKYLQDVEVLFTLEDKEYQSIKHWIFNELKLVKIGKVDEFDHFGFSIDSACIIDEIIDEIPEFIEDDKYNIIKNFHNKISNNPILLEDILKKYPDIRGTTCQKTGGAKFNKSTKGINYDYVIVDEAGRANPLDLLIPLIKGYKIILVGDHKQLPHMLENHVENKMKENENFNEKLYEKYIKESLFGRLFEQLPNDRKVMLDTQYRMTKEIGDLVSDLFYGGKLKTGTNIINDTNFYRNKGLVSINVKGIQKKLPSGSWINNNECEEIMEKLEELDNVSKGVDKKISVGIISFYKAQVENIKCKIRKLDFKNIEVEVGTVDAYQGLEKDIIFISSVRTDGIGFIANPNRLNVSLSRAKKLVVIFGDIMNLKKDKLFKQVIDKCADGGEI